MESNSRLIKWFTKVPDIVLCAVLSLGTLLRIVIQLKVPPITFAGGGVDEHIFIMQGTELLGGNWLGDYNSNTLVKNPTYSFFYFLIGKTGVPYTLGLILLYIIAIVLLLLAIRPLIVNKYYLAFSYLFLLYAPVMMDKKFGLRLYRDALLTPLVFFVLAGVIGLFLYRTKSKWISLAWGGLGGISFFFFYYLREDSIWLLPFFYTGLIITLIFVIFQKEKIYLKLIHIVILLLPVLIFKGGTAWLSYENLNHYGVYAVNDHTQTNFRKVITDLVSIDDGRDQTYIWVHQDAINQAMTVSPTFSKLKTQFDSFYIENSTLTTKIDSEEQAEIFSGKIVWLLRLAVEREGLGYQQILSVNGEKIKGGKVTDDFYKAIHEELTSAFNDGRLKRRSGGIAISKSAPAKSWNSILENVVPKIFYTMKETTMYRKYYVDKGISQVSGDGEAVRQIEMLLNTPLNYPPGTPQAEDNKPVDTMIKIINFIITLYKKTSVFVMVLSLCGFIFSLVGSFKRPLADEDFALPLLVLGLFLSYIILLLGVSWAYSWVSGETMNRLYFYSSGTIPVLQLIYVLCGYSFFQFIRKLTNIFR